MKSKELKNLSLSVVTMEAMLQKHDEYIIKEVGKMISSANSLQLNTESTLSPVGVSKTQKISTDAKKGSGLKFTTCKKDLTVQWDSWMDHDEQFKPMDEIAKKYKATRKKKTYTFSNRDDAMGFITSLEKLFPLAKIKKA